MNPATTSSAPAAPPAQPARSPDGLWFGKDLSESEAIPESAIEEAVALMRSGRLHRYGEQGAGTPEPSLLEQEYAAYVGAKYCVAVSSCGAAMFLALKALGVQPGDQVLTSSFTLAPVPGAIAHAGASAVLVETRDDYTTDLADLERKAASSGARVFLLSHMRGHITDLRAVRDICDRHGIALVEDCAHTMGARWDGQHTGTFGRIGCYSAQTYKHINAGEGGLLVTDDDDLAAQVILMSGCYMMYDQHLLRPPAEVFERWRYVTPNFSMRMSNLAAALLRPQIALLPERGTRWRRIYDDLAQAFAQVPQLSLPVRDAREDFVPSSIQFSLDLSPAQIEHFLAGCAARGLYIKWFGLRVPTAFTSHYGHWHYLAEQAPMPQSQAVLRQLLDLRTPLSLTPEDCRLIGQIVRVAAAAAADHPASEPSKDTP
ncbi:MAG: aminotransferase class I/II-fold pyridoxal phosphate-dependent enzyme [Burkholderiaceae bacterium]|nr:MAG: aminotransferase class I/II-fold pyridoxal phosphate-dependent enzyme [Burkholderiaceae bacterium]